MNHDLVGLLGYFKTIIHEERIIENIKEHLAQRPDFNYYDCFRAFD